MRTTSSSASWPSTSSRWKRSKRKWKAKRLPPKRLRPKRPKAKATQPKKANNGPSFLSLPRTRRHPAIWPGVVRCAGRRSHCLPEQVGIDIDQVGDPRREAVRRAGDDHPPVAPADQGDGGQIL